MADNGIRALKALGQSVWYDNCERRFVATELPRLIAGDGLPGMTSNPSIFQKAITGSDAYDAQIRELLARNAGTREMLDVLTQTDIRAACDAFRPLFAADPEDGRVSLEVSPALARDTAATIAEGLRLHALVDRPNVMIKVPATREGLPAIAALTAEGLDVNVTLIFSEARYREVQAAFLTGLERRRAAGKPLAGVESVASFFISRIDTAANKALPAGSPLRFTAGLATAKRVWAAFLEITGSDRFKALQSAGARPQRVLWASTGTKDPSLKPTHYVTPLVGPGTVTTLPPETYAAARELRDVRVTVHDGLDEAARTLAALEAAGVRMADVYTELEDAGVKSFADAWTALTAALEAKHTALSAAR